MRLIVVLLLVGCTQHRVVIEAGNLRGRAQELRTTGRAAAWLDDQHDGRSKQIRETIRADHHVLVDGTSQTLGGLVTPCDRTRPVADQPGCLLADLDNSAALVLRTYQRPRYGPIVGGAILISFTTAATCHFACADGTDARRYSDYVLIGASVVSAGAIVWIIVSCLTQGCRD